MSVPVAFDYCAAKSIDEAIALMQQYGDDAKLLAGGQSLLPTMKLRLAQPGYCQLNGFCADGFSFPWCSFPLPSGLFTSEQEEQVPPFPLS